ncbi:MAG TPA: helix-turn-helix transcriptional regulator [Kofleriaceae bacterium]|jgi:DNA-binding CsgD family transcriptional regulator|nr:helix-turn-helix transcriptional regulator [Kofleriaceae bacterium]
MSIASVLSGEVPVAGVASGRPAAQLASVDRAFVGRDRELAELIAAVTSGARRIWIGAGSGLGKTELLIQLAGRCRERGLPYHWLAPHEPATPRVLRAIAEALGRAGGARDGRRLIVIDDFARLRPIEPWFVERFLPALPGSVSVVIADRAAAPVWQPPGDGAVLALAPLAEVDARRYLAWRGVAGDRHAEIIAAAEGIPSILVAAAEAAADAPAALAVRGFADPATTFYTRHDSDDHRLAIAVLVAARTTPYELLELAFDDPHAARDAYAWLARLTVVEATPAGLRPDTVLRKAWQRELADRAPAVWARACRAVRVFTEHRIAMAHEPLRWLLDRLFVDRDAGALREHLILPAADPSLGLAALGPDDRPAVAALAAAGHGPRAGAAVARWLDDDRAAFDVLRDPDGQVQGYLCSIALTAAGEPTGDDLADGDPAVRHCVAHLGAIGWFGLATPPDARALVFRDWSVAGSHQAPSPGAALLLAQMAARVLSTPAVELAFVVTDRPDAWQRLLRELGLAPHDVGAHRWGDRRCTVLAVDWRGGSITEVLAAVGEAAVGEAAVGEAAPVATPRLAAAEGTRPMPITAAPTPGASAPGAPAGDRGARDEARELSAALERRIAQLAREAALSPRERQVLQLLLLGRNYAEIGVALQITPRTARFHQTNVLDKLGAESRLDLVRLLL